MNMDHAADILTTALEGGIGYWSVASDIIRDDDLRVRSVTLEDAEWYGECQYIRANGGQPDASMTPSFKAVTVTPRHVRRAIDLMASDAEIPYCPQSTRALARKIRHASGEAAEDILCDIDADHADNIVQVAALGHVVYG